MASPITASYLGRSQANPIFNLSKGSTRYRIQIFSRLPRAEDLKIAMCVPKCFSYRPKLSCFEKIFRRTVILRLSLNGRRKYVKLNKESLRKRLGIDPSLFNKALKISKNGDLTPFIATYLASSEQVPRRKSVYRLPPAKQEKLKKLHRQFMRNIKEVSSPSRGFQGVDPVDGLLH